MGWLMLILGVALWWGAHVFKRVMPEKRAALGDGGKGAVAIALVVSIVLMVLGYRGADGAILWSAHAFLTHVNNLLMLIAIYLLSPAPKRGRLVAGMRHPMLTGFSVWAVAHLMVNGDVPSLILFGGLLVWALFTMQLINRAEPDWVAPEITGTYAKDGMFLGGSVVLLIVIGAIHGWLGPWPFPG